MMGQLSATLVPEKRPCNGERILNRPNSGPIFADSGCCRQDRVRQQMLASRK
jgi:hypothetical protein